MQLSLFEHAGLDETGLTEPKKFTLEEIINIYKEVASNYYCSSKLATMFPADVLMSHLIKAAK